jgi:hypothetical protein
MPCRRSNVLAMLLVLAGCGQGSSSSPAAGAGRLVGRVVLTGLPPQAGLDVALSGSGPSLATTTRDDGTYEFTGLAPGDYTVTATVASTAEGTVSTFVWVGRDPVQALDLVLTPVGSVHGCVTLAFIPGPIGLPVTATAVDGTVYGALTDSMGCFDLADLVLGDYTIATTVPSTNEVTQSKVVSVGMGANNFANFVFLPYGYVTGRVVVSGEPSRASIVVQVSPFADTATTDANGIYRTRDYFPCSLTLTATAPSTVEGNVSVSATVTVGETVAPDMVFTPVGSLSGMVTLGGSVSAAGALVRLEGTDLAALTDASGNYLIVGALTGTYRVSAVTNGYQQATVDGQVVSWNATTQVPAIDLPADPPGPHATGTLAGYAAVAGLGVQAGIVVQVDGTSLSATSGPDGAWRIDGVPFGAWSLTLGDGVRREHVPAAVSLPGSDGSLLDERLYPIGTIELQGAPRICQGCAFIGGDPPGGLAIFVSGSRLLAAPYDGGAVRELANDVWTSKYRRAFVSQASPAGTGCWVVYSAADQSFKSVPCLGGPVQSMTGNTPGNTLLIGPTGDTVIAEGADASVWFADLAMGEARKVLDGAELSSHDVGRSFLGYTVAGTWDFGTISWADGSTALLAKRANPVTLLPGGERLFIIGNPTTGIAYVAAFVGPPGGPMTSLVETSPNVYLDDYGWSADGRFVAVATWDPVAQTRSLTVAETAGGTKVWSTTDVAGGDPILAWSPDGGRLAWPSSAGIQVTGVDGTTYGLPGCIDAHFSPDGGFIGCRAPWIGTPSAMVFDASNGSVVASMATTTQLEFVGAASDSSTFWFQYAEPDFSRVLVRLGVNGEGELVTDPEGISGPWMDDARRWMIFSTFTPDYSSGLFKALPARGGPAVALNPGLPIDASTWVRLVPETDAFIYVSGGNVYATALGGGASQLVGGYYQFSGPLVAPDGRSISVRGPDGVLRSAPLPAGTSGQDATGVGSVEFAAGGRVAWGSYLTDPSVGPFVGPLTFLGSGVTGSNVVGADGRLVFQGPAGDVFSARVTDADIIPLASCTAGLGNPFAAPHGDRVSFGCGGVLHTAPILGGPATPSVRMERYFGWIDDRHLVAYRLEAPSPYRFQNGIYLVTVP